MEIIQQPFQRANAKISDYQLISSLLKTIPFFKSKPDITNLDYNFLSTNLAYEYYGNGKVIYEYNSIADKFYILLDGKISVEAPNIEKNNIQEDLSVKNRPKIKELSYGMTFGEEALLSCHTNLYKRIGTAKTLTSVHLAALHNTFYSKIAQEIEQRKFKAQISFLNLLPVFKMWKKRNLEKIAYIFSKKTYVKGQSLYKAGDKASIVFLVISGEFEAITTIIKSNKDNDVYTGSDSQNIKSKSKFFLLFPIRKKIQVRLYNAGQWIGDDEAVLYQERILDVNCLSMTSEVYEVPATEFVQKIYSNSYSKPYFDQNFLIKKDSYKISQFQFTDKLNTFKDLLDIKTNSSQSNYLLKSESLNTTKSLKTSRILTSKKIKQWDRVLEVIKPFTERRVLKVDYSENKSKLYQYYRNMDLNLSFSPINKDSSRLLSSKKCIISTIEKDKDKYQSKPKQINIFYKLFISNFKKHYRSETTFDSLQISSFLSNSNFK